MIEKENIRLMISRQNFVRFFFLVQVVDMVGELPGYKCRNIHKESNQSELKRIPKY